MIFFNELNQEEIEKTVEGLRSYYGDTVMKLPYKVSTLAAILDLSERLARIEEKLGITHDAKQIAKKYLKES